jgi:hypothetical protein
MKTLEEADTALREFDDRHWKHAPGPRSIVHTFLHLMIALQRAHVSNMKQALENREDDWRTPLASRFIEHALRIARHANFSPSAIAYAIPFEGNPNVYGEITGKLVWQNARAHGMFEGTPGLVHAQGAVLLSTCQSSLLPLSEACHELDEGEFVNVPMRSVLLRACGVLLGHAAAIGLYHWPPSERFATYQAHVIEEFLAPFEERVQELWARKV